MNKADFFNNLINYTKTEGFSFFVSGEDFQNSQRLSEKRQLTYRAVFLLAANITSSLAGLNMRYMIFGGLNPSTLSTAGKEALITDLQKVQSYCDLIAIKTSNGPALLRLVVDADDISDELLIGRFAIIHELAHNFRKHSSFLFVSKDTFAVYAQVVIVFSSHDRAKKFIQDFAGKCNHSAIWKKVYTCPWIADLEAEEIKRYRQPFDRLPGKAEKLKAEIFRKQCLLSSINC